MRVRVPPPVLKFVAIEGTIPHAGEAILRSFPSLWSSAVLAIGSSAQAARLAASRVRALGIDPVAATEDHGFVVRQLYRANRRAQSLERRPGCRCSANGRLLAQQT